MSKERLDILLVESGLADTRTKAQAIIMSGAVLVDGKPSIKAGSRIPKDAKIEIVGTKPPYVSRGGLKIEKALDAFGIQVEDKICLDIGASTGGFTDCLLKRGAGRVFAVDVGYGQLDYSLRENPRVVCLEKKNARYLTTEDVPHETDLITVDVSFISLLKIIPRVQEFLTENGELICLIKPQFEAERKNIKKGGVVKDPAVHKEVLKNIIENLQKLPLRFKALDFSPLLGPAGNIEYLCLFQKIKDGDTSTDPHKEIPEPPVDEIVEEAFEILKKHKR